MMTFEELLDKVAKTKYLELRNQEEGYLEIVISKLELITLSDVLQSYFGLPLKPQGQDPSKQADEYAAPYGGIQSNQIMYFRQDGSAKQFAFLWPWGDGKCITVKIIRG